MMRRTETRYGFPSLKDQAELDAEARQARAVFVLPIIAMVCMFAGWLLHELAVAWHVYGVGCGAC